MSGRKGNLASRSLEYRAPEVPNFLKALKAQVASSERYSSASGRSGDELDCFVSSTSSSGKRKAREEEEDALDSDDELNGAQVVVLKDGKHLSQDEALELKKAQIAQGKEIPTSPGGDMIANSQSIARSGTATLARKRRQPIETHAEPRTDLSISSIIQPVSHTKGESTTKTSGKSALEDVKVLIRKERQLHSNPKPTSYQKTKEDLRKEKNAQARKLKAQSGKGLSFNLDE